MVRYAQLSWIQMSVQLFCCCCLFVSGLGLCRVLCMFLSQSFLLSRLCKNSIKGCFATWENILCGTGGIFLWVVMELSKPGVNLEKLNMKNTGTILVWFYMLSLYSWQVFGGFYSMGLSFLMCFIGWMLVLFWVLCMVFFPPVMWRVFFAFLVHFFCNMVELLRYGTFCSPR